MSINNELMEKYKEHLKNEYRWDVVDAKTHERREATFEEFVEFEEIKKIQNNSEKYSSEIIEKGVEKVANCIPKNLSDVKKMRLVYNWFIQNQEYFYPFLEDQDKEEYWIDAEYNNEMIRVHKASLESVFLPNFYCGVCKDFARAYKLVCAKLGIHIDEISGRTSPEYGHMWNVVKLNGETLHIDITYGIYARDNKFVPKGTKPEDFFLISFDKLKKLNKTRVINEKQPYSL